jgi:hypothetical protein
MPLIVGLVAALIVIRIKGKSVAALKSAAIVAVGAAIVAAMWTPDLLSPYQGISADWCLKSDGLVQVAGTLYTDPWYLRGTLVGSPVPNFTTQVKVYEAGKGDPPYRGPASPATDAHGVFKHDFAAPEKGKAYVLYIAYRYNTLAGERLYIRNFQKGYPSPCL